MINGKLLRRIEHEKKFVLFSCKISGIVFKNRKNGKNNRKKYRENFIRIPIAKTFAFSPVSGTIPHVLSHHQII